MAWTKDRWNPLTSFIRECLITICLQTDSRPRQRSRGNVKKNSLNQIDDDSTDGDDDADKLTTQQMLEEYSALKDSSMDPDFVPSEEPSSEEISSEREERTESQKKMNGKLKWKGNST